MKREPKTTSAWSSTIGWMSWGYSAGSYSRSASWTMTIWPVACAEAGAERGALALVDLVVDDLQVAVACSISRRISRVPSVEQSSTTMISLRIGTARTRRRISWMVFFSL